MVTGQAKSLLSPLQLLVGPRVSGVVGPNLQVVLMEKKAGTGDTGMTARFRQGWPKRRDECCFGPRRHAAFQSLFLSSWR